MRACSWACIRLVAAGLGLAAGSACAQGDGALTELEDALNQPVYGNPRSAGASKYDQDAGNAPATVYVRTAGEIRAHGYRTLAEVLESMPGIHLRNDRAYTYVGIRGINVPGEYSSRLLILVDGARINDAIYDTALGGREFVIDVDLIERVEFMPGPGSSLYGSNALLGVVNVFTRNPSQLAGTQARAEAGSAGSRKLGASWAGALGAARVLLGGSAERRPGRALYFPEFDDPSTNGGVAPRGSDAEAVDKLFAKVRVGDATVLAAVSDRRKRVPTAAFGADFNTTEDWIDRNGLLDASWSRALGPHREVQARIGVGFYNYLALNDLSALGTPEVTENRSRTRWWSGELRHLWLGWSGHRVLTGLELQNNVEQELLVSEPIRARASRQALYVDDEWRLHPALTLNLGLRGDHRLDGGNVVTPRVAAIWSPDPDWTFKLLRGRAFREPNMYETRYEDSTQRVNPSLRTETLRSSELAAAWRASSSWTVSASLWSFRIRDLLELRPQSDGLNAFENRGTLHSRGGEVEATYVSAGGVQWRSSWSRQQSTGADGAPPADMPRSLAKSLVTTPAPWPGGQLGLHLLRTGERHTLSGARLPAHAVVNAHVTHAPPQQRWRGSVGVYNLGGRDYSDPAGPEHVQDALARDGRELRLRLDWAF